MYFEEMTITPVVGGDGEVYNFIAIKQAVPVRDAVGDRQKWIGTCTDIHEFKQAEAPPQPVELQLRQLQELESTGRPS